VSHSRFVRPRLLVTLVFPPLKGQLLLKQLTRCGVSQAAEVPKAAIDVDSPTFAKAEHAFTQSIKIAQRQGAKSLSYAPL
jgi:hypothetical protein